jgi:hypothetical protein
VIVILIAEYMISLHGAKGPSSRLYLLSDCVYCGIVLKFFPPNHVPTGPPAPRQIVTKRNFTPFFHSNSCINQTTTPVK